MPVGQLAEFRVYPGRPSRLFYRVRLFTTLTALRGFLQHGPIPRRPHRCVAWTSCWAAGPPDELGEILFAARHLTVDIVSHECTHAALGWARRVGVDPTECRHQGHRIVGDEERFCAAQDTLVGQIAQRLWTLGLIQP